MVMPAKTVSMPKLIAAFLKWFVDDDYCFEQVTVNNGGAADINVDIGTPLGQVTATGDVVVLAHGAADGSQNWYAFTAAAVTVPAGGSATVLMIRRGPAIVLDSGIEWPATADVTDKTNAVAAAEAAGIRVVSD